MKKFFLISASVMLMSVLLLAACSDDDDTQVWQVAPVYGWTCDGSGYKTAAYFVNTGQGTWRKLAVADFQNFAYEEGNLYSIQVQVETIANPPADASNLRVYVLNILSKTPTTELPTGISADDVYHPTSIRETCH